MNIINVVESEDGNWIGIYTTDSLLADEGHNLDWVALLQDGFLKEGYDEVISHVIPSSIIEDELGGRLPFNFNKIEEFLL